MFFFSCHELIPPPTKAATVVTLIFLTLIQVPLSPFTCSATHTPLCPACPCVPTTLIGLEMPRFRESVRMYNPSLDTVDTFDGSWDKAEMLERTRAGGASASSWKIENSAGMQAGERRYSNAQSKRGQVPGAGARNFKADKRWPGRYTVTGKSRVHPPEPGPRARRTPQCGLLGWLQAGSVKAPSSAPFGK